MRNFLFITAFAILITAALGQTIQIGSGSLLRQGLPLKPYLHYSYSQQIYYASEIGNPGLITGISFEYDVHSTAYYQNNCQIRVWMACTPRSELNSWMDTDSLSLVFDGQLSRAAYSEGLPGTGWMHIEFDTAFDYSLQSNLLIAVKEDSPGRGNTQDDFFCTPHPSNRSMACADIEDFAIGDFPPSSTTVRQAYANLRLQMISSQVTPILPSPAHNSTDVPLDSAFSWTSTADSFDFYLGSHPDQLELIQSNILHTSYNLSEPLQMLSTYYWQVLGHQNGNVYPSEIWCFISCGEALDPPQDFQAWHQNDSVHLSWNPPMIGNPCEYLIYKNGLLGAATSSCTYIDYSVNPGNTYSYFIKARNQHNQLSAPTPALSVTIPYNDPNQILFQDFEALPLWSSEIPGWIILDLDQSPTWHWNEYDFPNAGQACGWMVFSPAFTSPPHNFLNAHSGQKMLISPDALNPPDNNWLISPSIYLGVNPSLSFWARSFTDVYGLERLKVLVSTSEAEPNSFIPLHGSPWLNIPATWTLYEYDLGAFQNQNVRLAWQAISNDAMALFLDDIEIRGTNGYISTPEELAPTAKFCISPNPSKGAFEIQGIKGQYELSVYDIKGRKLHQSMQQEGSSLAHLQLSNGVYILKIKQQGSSHHARLVICK